MKREYAVGADVPDIPRKKWSTGNYVREVGTSIKNRVLSLIGYNPDGRIIEWKARNGPSSKMRKVLTATSFYVGSLLSGLAIAQQMSAQSSDLVNNLPIYTLWAKSLITPPDVWPFLIAQNLQIPTVSEKAWWESVNTTTISPKPTAKEIAEAEQKLIDAKLKELLIYKGMKGELAHEWIPRHITNYETYIKRQDRSLKLITEQIEKFNEEDVLREAMSTSKEDVLRTIEAEKKQERFTTQQQPSRPLVKLGKHERNSEIRENTGLSTARATTNEIWITPENFTPEKLERFLVQINDSLTSPDKKSPFNWALLIMKQVHIKGTPAWRVFLKYDGHIGYITLKPGQKSRNYKIISTESEFMKWMDRKIRKWQWI